MKTLIHHSKAERFDVCDGEATLVCRGCCWRCKEDFFYFAESARDTISFRDPSFSAASNTKSSNEAPRPELQRVVLLTVGKPRSSLLLGWVHDLNRAGDGFAVLHGTLEFSLCVPFLMLYFRSWLSSPNSLYAMEVLLILATTLCNHPDNSPFFPK